MSKKRILWLSDSPTTHTGFGVVAKNLIDNICSIMGDDVQIDGICINVDTTELIQYNKQTTICDGTIDGNTHDPFCRSFFLNVLKGATSTVDSYDAVFILQDFAVVSKMIDIMRDIKADKIKKNQKSFKTFLYAPVDGYTAPVFLEKINFFDYLITYTDYGKEEILKLKPELRSKIKVVPHGCNTNDFFKITEIGEFRKEFFGKNADKIIYINVNRNQPRKGIIDTIFSFVEAKNNWTLERKPFLYLNMGRNDNMGYDLDQVFAQTDLVEGEDYMLAPDDFYGKDKWGVETEVLNKIYNASDIFITTTLGEGWGLSVTEAMAVRLPVICPNHTSLTYISGNGTRAYTIDNLYPTCYILDNIVRKQVDIYETADVMIEAAQQVLDGSNKPMLDKAEAFIKSLDWKGIANKFVTYFKEAL